MRPTTRPAIRYLACTVLSLALLPATAPAGELNERVVIPDGGRLRIELDRGWVEFTKHDAPDVRIEARAEGLGATSVHFDLSRTGDALVLREREDRWLGWIRGGPRITVRVWIPEWYRVEQHSAGGIDVLSF